MSAATRYTIQGRKVSLPVEVRRATNASALWLVPAAAVAPSCSRATPSSPSTWAAARPSSILGLIDYQDNDLGDYREVAVIFFVHPRGTGPEQAGSFIWRLPVDQSFTCEAGCTIWGFPKSVEKIDYDYAAGPRHRHALDGRPPRLHADRAPGRRGERRRGDLGLHLHLPPRRSPPHADDHRRRRRAEPGGAPRRPRSRRPPDRRRAALPRSPEGARPSRPGCPTCAAASARPRSSRAPTRALAQHPVGLPRASPNRAAKRAFRRQPSRPQPRPASFPKRSVSRASRSASTSFRLRSTAAAMRG